MRLLHAETITVVDFPGPPPRYAILSHTWDEEEVMLRDLESGGKATQKKGYAKLEKCCALAAGQGYEYIWVDTCCIDKTSSAELSEAINSMFAWYREGQICYAYLSDFDGDNLEGVEHARWFTRGWTLQELIAPRELHFYNKDWLRIGSRSDAVYSLGVALKMPAEPLLGLGLKGISLLQRMQWAARRKTTRPEDMAYCLLGLFDVNMPLLYGEGKKKAFRRLQEEIIKSSTDLSIFLWTLPQDQIGHPGLKFRGLLADDPLWFDDRHGPKDFKFEKDENLVPTQDPSISLNNRGVLVNWSITPTSNDPYNTIFVVILLQSGKSARGILIQQLDNDASQFCRVAADAVIWTDGDHPLGELNVGQGYRYRDVRVLARPDTVIEALSFYMRQDFEQPLKPSLDAMGFSFCRDTVANPWAFVVAHSLHFGQLRTSTQFAPIPDSVRALGSLSEKDRSKAIAALVIRSTRPSGQSFYKCVVVGITILRNTPLGTINAFTIPWITIEDGEDIIAAMRSAELTENHVTRIYWQGLPGYLEFKLEKVTRLNGNWYDIQVDGLLPGY